MTSESNDVTKQTGLARFAEPCLIERRRFIDWLCTRSPVKPMSRSKFSQQWLCCKKKSTTGNEPLILNLTAHDHLAPITLPYTSIDSDIDGSGTKGDIEIRIFQGKAPNEIVVGETTLPLKKLPVEGFDRKP